MRKAVQSSACERVRLYRKKRAWDKIGFDFLVMGRSQFRSGHLKSHEKPWLLCASMKGLVKIAGTREIFRILGDSVGASLTPKNPGKKHTRLAARATQILTACVQQDRSFSVRSFSAAPKACPEKQVDLRSNVRTCSLDINACYDSRRVPVER
jgi:hypothetical protein